jgi:DNA-binding CsgD family transcriptional regulator
MRRIPAALERAGRALRRDGLSIGQIARRLQLAESTIHRYVGDIPLTRAQCRRLQQHWQRRMAQVNHLRRGIALKHIEFRRPRWSARLVHLVSHLSLDGRIDRYGCHYYNREKSAVSHVQTLLQRLLGVEAKVRRRVNGIYVASFFHVEVAAGLADRERELLNMVARHPLWQRVWLQALFDDEGHVHWVKGRRRVRASQKDPAILRTAQDYLRRQDIDSRIDTAARAVEITGRRSLTRFANRVGFSRGLHVNPARRNGHWKTAWEKQDLLRMALASYKPPVL